MKHKMQDTSLRSYDEIKDSLGKKQAFVLNGFREILRIQKNATDMEVARFLNVDTNIIRPRRYELVNKYKQLGVSEKRICSITGKKAIAWKLNRIERR